MSVIPTLDEVLAAREARSCRIADALSRLSCPLVSFSMNIPGPRKNSALIRLAFREGCHRLEKALSAAPLPFHAVDRIETSTGCEALYAVTGDALAVKQLCCAIEDMDELGRLFDLDVICPGGKKVERTALSLPERGCMVCGTPGRGCASRRIHSAEELQQETARRLTTALSAALLSRLVTDSLTAEVRATPKPGLVDAANNGSHTDMDLPLFLTSADALAPFWGRFFELGQQTAALPPEETFPLLRTVGLDAERVMLAATGGINTHKGAIFLLGLICGAVGRLWTSLTPPASGDILTECRRMAAASMAQDWARIRQLGGTTVGARLYLTCGLRGARGEAEDGFPSVRATALPALRAALTAGLGADHAAAVTLLHLIALGKDTNMFHRGGAEGAAWGAEAAQTLLAHDPYPSTDAIAALDRAFIARNLSPGGSADLLAVTLFLHALERFEQDDKS